MESSATPLAQQGCRYYQPGRSAFEPDTCECGPRPTGVSGRYAASYCLTSEYTRCSRFVAVESGRAPVGPAGPQQAAFLGRFSLERLRSISLPRPAVRVPQFRVPAWPWRALAVLVLLPLLLAAAAFAQRDALGARFDNVVPSAVKGSVVQAVDGMRTSASGAIGSVREQVGRASGTPTAAKAATRKATAVTAKVKGRTTRRTPTPRPAASKAGKGTARTPTPAAAKALLASVRVSSGDSLRSLARKYYGDERLWPVIWTYNKRVAAARGYKLGSPDVIYPGVVLHIPKLPKKAP